MDEAMTTAIKAAAIKAAAAEDIKAAAAAAAAALTASLTKATSAGNDVLLKAYGADTTEDAPKSLRGAITCARNAARVIAGESQLPAKGESRTFIQRTIASVTELGVVTPAALVEAARVVIAADRVARNKRNAAKVQSRKERAAALNEAIRLGDVAAAAEAAGIAAADQAEAAHAKRETSLARFARACESALSAGIPLVSLFETLASSAGIESPVITVPENTPTVTE